MELETVVAENVKTETLKDEPDYIEIDIPYNLFHFFRSKNYDIQSICRLCLSTNNDVLYSLISESGDNLLANMLTILSSLELSPKDGLPTNVCELCQSLVIQYYEFKVKCEKSDYILRSVLKGGFVTKEELFDSKRIIQKDKAVDKGDGSEIKQEMGYEADIQYLEDLSDDDDKILIQDTGKKQSKRKMFVAAVSNKNRSTETIKQVREYDTEVQYLEDLSEDTNSDNNLYQIQRKGRKRKRIKSTSNGYKYLERDVDLVKKRKSRKPSKCYTCGLCSKVFLKAKAFNMHMKNNHDNIAGERAYPCAQCKASFDTEHDLIVHSALHPQGTSWKCNQCLKEFNSKTTLHRHIQRHMEKKPHSCNTCGKTFTELCALRRHNRVHTGERIEKKHVCHICQKRYSSSSLLAAHMSRHIGLRPYECATCGKPFPSPRLLRSHMLVHSDSKPYACEYCDKRFRHESTRNTHHRTHTGEKPYVCSVCGKTFIQNSNLTLHMRSHTGERPYSCKVCDRRFTSGSTLKTHERIHTGEKPYSCKLCGKTFARMNLNMHMRQHSGERPFGCATCPKRFLTASRLRDHCRIHTGEKPYECSLCSFIFSTRSHLIKHLKKHEQPKKKTQKRELAIVRRIPAIRNNMENTTNKNNEELENVTKDSDVVENIDKNITIGLFEDVPLEVNREFALQDDGDMKDVLIVDNCQNTFEINSDVCLNKSKVCDVNFSRDVKLETVSEDVSCSSTTLEETTVKL